MWVVIVPPTNNEVIAMHNLGPFNQDAFDAGFNDCVTKNYDAKLPTGKGAGWYAIGWLAAGRHDRTAHRNAASARTILFTTFLDLHDAALEDAVSSNHPCQGRRDPFGLASGGSN